MSLSWRDELRLALCPDRIIAVRRTQGLRSRVVDSRNVPARPSSAPNWRGAIAALQAYLCEAGRNRTSATVVLSNHFVRYTLLPWSENLASESEWDGFAAHRFASIYGAAASDSSIRISPAPSGAPRLASAIDPDLVQGVIESFRQSKITLQSIQPYLMAAFNRLCRLLPKEQVWLMLQEPGLVTLGFTENRKLRHVRLRRFDPAGGDSLATLLEREIRLLAMDSRPTRVVTACIDDPARLFDSGVSFRIEDWALAERDCSENGRTAATL